MDHVFASPATVSFVFQKMAAIKRNYQDIKKVGILMTGHLTLMSTGNVTQENLKMLHGFNE